MSSGVARFREDGHIYRADTCEPLKQAATRGDVCLIARGRGAYPGPPLPARSLLELRSVGCWDAQHDQAWGLDWHRNEGIELTYLARGKLAFSVDGREYVLRRGDLTITRPWQVHRVGNPNVSASRLYWLILDLHVRRPNQRWVWPRWLVSSEGDIAALTDVLSHNEQPVWRAGEEIASYFEELGGAIESCSESHMRLYISGLVVALTDMLRRQSPPLDRSLSSAQRTVELFLESLPEAVEEPWDLTSMAAACGLGRSRFAHYCRELTNMPPIEYLTRCRLEVASRMLLERRRTSVTDVALRCGFESAQYFARVFRRYTGCSPREFRRSGDSARAEVGFAAGSVALR